MLFVAHKNIEEWAAFVNNNKSETIVLRPAKRQHETTIMPSMPRS